MILLYISALTDGLLHEVARNMTLEAVKDIASEVMQLGDAEIDQIMHDNKITTDQKHRFFMTWKEKTAPEGKEDLKALFAKVIAKRLQVPAEVHDILRKAGNILPNAVTWS